MDLNTGSIYAIKHPAQGEENFLTLFQNGSIRIEGIRSHHKTLGQIYNQNEDEWVLLVQGKGVLKIQETLLELKSGDYIYIPRHTPHQVVSTDEDTVWIGIFSS